MQLLTLYNAKSEIIKNPIKLSRVYGSNKVNRYRLEENIAVQLSNGAVLNIPKGYEWDLSSVPRLFWIALAPDGDFQLAALIHDYLYENALFSRKFADAEMLRWSKILNGTKKLISFRNFDNYSRYYGVRIFGWLVWYNFIKL